MRILRLGRIENYRREQFVRGAVAVVVRDGLLCHSYGQAEGEGQDGESGGVKVAATSRRSPWGFRRGFSLRKRRIHIWARLYYLCGEPLFEFEFRFGFPGNLHDDY